MKLGSLFDGAGGFPYAGAMAGFTPVWASEIEPFPIRVTTRRFPQMKHLGNITEMSGREAEPVDVITFGSPCQDLSVAGRREGLDGERSGLFRQAIRIIREMREATNGQQPKYIVWENVPGAFSSNKGEDFRTVLEEIAKIKDSRVSIPRPDKGKWMFAGEIVGDDYSIAWRTYDAQYWGVPQRRKRIYLVADFTGRRAGRIQFERESLCGNPAQGGRQGQGAAGTPAGDAGTPIQGDRVICLMDMGGSKMDITEGITGTLRAGAKGHDPIIADTWAIQGSMIGREEKNGPQGGGINKNVSFTLNTSDRHAVIDKKPLAFHLTQDPITSETVTPCISTGNSRNGQAVIGAVVPKATVYGLSAKDSNAWKSGNPHSGCYEAEATRTLDTHGGNPTCAQGGNIIVQEARVFENHSQDSRYRDLGQICETVAAKYGTGGNNMPIVVEGTPYSIGNGQVHDLGLDEKAKTLSCMHDQQAVIIPAYGIDRAAFNQGRNAQYNFSIEEELEPCLVAKGPNAVAHIDEQQGYPYRARRLTPLECCRLQGYPDWWRTGLDTPEPTEDEVDEWLEIFETHRQAIDPDKKPKTRNQVRKWLKYPQTDSAEYRMWGNSLAIPNAYQVLAGIAAELQAEQERPLYIASWSGGKDSTASIILAHEHGEPLDLIIFSEVMFDSETSGELPEHIDFVKNTAIPIFESWGYTVKVLHAGLTYMDIFMREPTRGKRYGMGLKTGFPMAGRCQINRSVKIKPIEDFLKTLERDYTQYIGIAADEPKRLEAMKERCQKKGWSQVSLLEKYGCTEQRAKELCEKYGLLSPVYDFTPRGGCWFCPNARRGELRNLRDNHPDLWQRLLDLENEPNLIGAIWNSLEKKSIHRVEEMFRQEDAQLTIWDIEH